MTVVNEHSRVPQLDAAALEKLASSLDREGVVAAMLIGSQGRARTGPLSDIDIGVWHEPGLDGPERLALQLELAAKAGQVLDTDEVDVVLLNSATPLMRHRAIRDGRRLLERDAKSRVRFESRAILDYLDTKPLREELARGLHHRIAEGRFGRR